MAQVKTTREIRTRKKKGGRGRGRTAKDTNDRRREVVWQGGIEVSGRGARREAGHW